MSELQKILSISSGAILGALARYYCTIGIENTHPTAFPLGTFFVNCTGSFLITIVAVLIAKTSGLPLYLAPFLIVGFLGSFTTFSAFSLETLKLFQNEQPGLAITYGLVSLNGGVLFAWLGYYLAKMQFSGTLGGP